MLMNPSQTLLYNVVCFACIIPNSIDLCSIRNGPIVKFLLILFFTFSYMLCYMYFGIFFIFDDFVTIVMCAKELNNYCFFLTGRYLCIDICFKPKPYIKIFSQILLRQYS